MRRPADQTTPIEQLLRRGHGWVAAATLASVGLVTMIAAVMLLRAEAGRSLDLVARAAAYSVEAAVLFEDSEEAEGLLRTLAMRERVESIEVQLADGRVLARAEHRDSGVLGGFVEPLVSRLFDLEAQAPVRKNDRTYARVRLRGDGQNLARLLLSYGVAVAAAMAVSLLAVLLVARRQRADLVAPLDRLSRFTRAVRSSRDFDQRAAPERVAEIDALAEDFNALLAEMQAHESELLARQARLRTRNEALRQQAEHDALTGLPNRAQFSQRLEAAVERAEAEVLGLGVMFVDADHFKAINDDHGHDAGDRVLVEIARRLQRSLREADFVARLGGDEFAILLEPLSDPADADVVARKIEGSMRTPLALPGGGQMVPQVSVGLASYPADGTSAEALLRAADQAMYRAKRTRGRARVV